MTLFDDHTPAPWYAFQNFVSDKKDFGFSADGSRIGETPNWVIDAESEADAHLIAAAPELLEAARRAEAMIALIGVNAYQVGLEGTSDWDRVSVNSDIQGTLGYICAAIAKAEGRS